MATLPGTPGPTPAPWPCVRPLDDGRATRLEVRAQPGAKRSGFAGFWNQIPKIAVCAPPAKGRANEEIVAAIAALFGLRASAVSQISGATSRAKVFRLECASARVALRLTELEAEGHGARGHRSRPDDSRPHRSPARRSPGEKEQP